MFQVAGGCGLGALDAAKEKSVWGIGVDADQAYVNNRVLTSAQKKVDVAVYTAIAGLKNGGKFAGGTNLLFNAANGGVGLGTINKGVPAADQGAGAGDREEGRSGSDQAAHEVLAEPELLGGSIRGGGPCARPRSFCRRSAPGIESRAMERGPRPRASRDHEALSGRSSRTTTSTSTCGAARCTRCSARTAPASRR